MVNHNISIAGAKQLDMVDFLANLGYKAQKIRNNDHWYLSPLRDEKTPSFKVNRQLNLWYDHGTGEGGNLVDFGVRYFRCSVREFLQKIAAQPAPGLSFHPRAHTLADEKKEASNESSKIKVLSSGNINDPALLKYLDKRQILLSIASEFCEEIVFQLYEKNHTAIGFKNGSGGYELRNEYFKGSSSPKEPRLISQNNADSLAVFEGFFSFLSFQTLQRSDLNISTKLPKLHGDMLVLNSLSLFDKSRELMESYSSIHLFLDRDKMGQQKTQQALKWSEKYKDQSHYYHRFKDLNECLVKSIDHELKQNYRRGMRL